MPIANVHAELVCGFCDDLYHPKSEQMLSEFMEKELKDLTHLYDVLCEAATLEVNNTAELIKHPKWRTVIMVARRLNEYYEQNA